MELQDFNPNQDSENEVNQCGLEQEANQIANGSNEPEEEAVLHIPSNQAEKTTTGAKGSTSTFGNENNNPTSDIEFIRTKASEKSKARRSTVFGFGVNDSEYNVYMKVGGKNIPCPFYRKWLAMIERCYSDNFQKERPTYRGCSVCAEWSKFSVFLEWMESKDWSGKQLDKDLLVPGNKVYSPETCLFVTTEVNTILNDCGLSRGDHKIGVSVCNKTGRYKSACRAYGKTENLGTYETEGEAAAKYLEFKSNYIREISESQDVEVRDALLLRARIMTKEATKLNSDTPKYYGSGFYSGISNADYHATNDTSSTNLKDTMDSMHYYKLRNDGSLLFPATKSMDLGTAVHALVLEPANFYNDIAVSPEFGYKAVDKEAKAEFEERNAGKTIISREQYLIAKGMAESVLRHEGAKWLLKDSVCEHSGFYIDPETGIACKYRPDSRKQSVMSDLKTTNDVSKDSFAKTIARFGYHISAAHYLEGDRVLHGTDHETFVFIAVSNKKPYEVAIYPLGQRSLQEGYKERLKALNRIKLARETGVYPLINEGKALEIDIPNWAFNKD